jgi:cysteine synthase A
VNKPAAIWLFAGGAMQEYAARRILELGYKLILTDRDPDCVCARYASEFVELDTFDQDGNAAAARRLRTKYAIAAGITVAADCHETVAIVNRGLGLAGISPELSHVCRYKDQTRSILTSAGIPQPRYARVSDLSEARAFLGRLGGCGVVKATDSSGSRGFAMVSSVNELTPDLFDLARDAGSSGAAIVEEALNPRQDCIAEQSIETVWHNGRMYWLNWVDRLFRSDLRWFASLAGAPIPSAYWGVEVGHINPACHDISVRNSLHAMIFSAGLAIGMQNEVGGHVLKADIMLTEQGPIILELTPRLSGGWDSSGTTPSRGADFQGGALRLALGHELDLELWHSHFEFKNPSLYSSIIADISPGARDNIGRKFSLGSDFDRERSLRIAFNHSQEREYVVPMV